MSLCFRTLPNKLSTLVGSRKPPTKFNRHQPRQNKSSDFLKQFLNTQKAISTRVNTTSETSVFSVACVPQQNLLPTFLDPLWNKKFIEQYNYDKESRSSIYWIQTCRSHRPQKLGASGVIFRNRKHITPIEITPNDVTVFQMQNIVDNDNCNSFLDNSRLVECISEKNLRDSQKSNIKDSILLTNNMNLKASQPQSSSSSQNNESQPSQEQLQSVFDCLGGDLPKLFVKPMNYSIYTKNLIFINNIRGVTTNGVMNYIKQITLLKMIGHMKFAHVKFDIIKITMHPEDATIKVRWRIRGISGLKMLSIFWKYKVWKVKETVDEYNELWYDGFSTYYVNGEGKVYKHVADKVMPDQDQITNKKEDLNIAPKLALFTGLASMLDNDDEDFFGFH